MIERLSLPEPSEESLRLTLQALDQHLTPQTPGHTGWALGGAAVLSARWKHRRSGELNISVHPRTTRECLGRESNPSLWRRLQKAGATCMNPGETPWLRFGNTRINLVPARPIPEIGESLGMLGTQPATVLSSAQILTPKLSETEAGTRVGDLYDLAVSGRRDQEALEVAVNATDEGWLTAVRVYWHARRLRYRHEAEDGLQDVPWEYRDIQEDPAGTAEAGVYETLYTRLTIRVGESTVHVRSENRKGYRERRYRSIAEMKRGFERHGTNAALRARGYNSGRTRNRCGNALSDGRDETVIDYRR